MKPPFDVVVSDHGATVFRVVRSLLSQADAEDAWSETFLAALEAYPRLDEDARIAAWLVTIAHRKAVDVLRVQQRTVPHADVPDRAVAAVLPDLDLRSALAQLPARQRACVVLHHLGGLPFREVAASEGCSPAAARKASADGVRALRIALEGDGSVGRRVHDGAARVLHGEEGRR